MKKNIALVLSLALISISAFACGKNSATKVTEFTIEIANKVAAGEDCEKIKKDLTDFCTSKEAEIKAAAKDLIANPSAPDSNAAAKLTEANTKATSAKCMTDTGVAEAYAKCMLIIAGQ